MSALREHLASPRSLQGAPLPINTLARQLGVSQTPVREALAMLAGEGLIARTEAGYAGLVHDPVSLRDLYDLARILTLAHDAAGGDWPFVVDDESEIYCGAIQGGNPALARMLALVRARLKPFALAEARVLTGVEVERARLASALNDPPRMRTVLVRRFHDRRARVSGRILAAALGLVADRRI